MSNPDLIAFVKQSSEVEFALATLFRASVRAAVDNHPEVVAAVDTLIRTVLDVAKDGIETLIEDVPVVGPLVEKLAAPILDGAESKVEAAADKAVADEIAELGGAA
jgi:hypothetical protein